MNTSLPITALLLVFAIGCSDSGTPARMEPGVPHTAIELSVQQPLAESAMLTRLSLATSADTPVGEMPEAGVITSQRALSRTQIDDVASGTGDYSRLGKVLCQFDLSGISDEDYHYLTDLTRHAEKRRQKALRTYLKMTGMIVSASAGPLCPLVAIVLANHLPENPLGDNEVTSLMSLKHAVDLAVSRRLPVIDSHFLSPTVTSTTP